MKQNCIHASVAGCPQASGGPVGTDAGLGEKDAPAGPLLSISLQGILPLLQAQVLAYTRFWRPTVEFSFPDFNDNNKKG